MFAQIAQNYYICSSVYQGWDLYLEVYKMSVGRKTTVFVSSTCFDLAQIRFQLFEFIHSMGFEPIMSEFDTFPVNPAENLVSNCLNVVKSSSDIFLLVVGGRYGFITNSGKSVTNLEFIEAKASGLPIYVYIKRDILTMLPVWKSNPDADFSAVVDSPQLFQFISDIKDASNLWIFPFDNASDITEAFKKQIGYLISESLDLRKKLSNYDSNLLNLKPTALRIAIDKQLGWEWLLFAQVLSDSISSYQSKRLDCELGISYGEPIVLKEVSEVCNWVLSRLTWMQQTINQLSGALNSGFLKAVGEPGEAGDIARIIHLATRISDGYYQLLDWKLQFYRVDVDEDFQRLIDLMSEFSSNSIRELEEFNDGLLPKIKGILENIKSYEVGSIVNIELTLTCPEMSEYFDEINRLRSLYIEGP